MQQVIRQYMPDSEGGFGKKRNGGASSGSIGGSDDLSGTGVGATDDSDVTGSGSLNVNDDDLGTADLGVANIGMTTGVDAGNGDDPIPGEVGTVDINNVSELDRTMDLDDDDMALTDIDTTNGTNVGAGGDLNSPGIGTLDDFRGTSNATADVDEDLDLANISDTGRTVDDDDELLVGDLGAVGAVGAVGAGAFSQMDADTDSTGSMSSSNVDTDQTATQSDQNSTDSQGQAEQQRKTILVAVAVSLAVIGAVWLLSRGRSKGEVSAYDKAKYRHKAKSVKDSVEDVLDETPLNNTSLKPGPLDSIVDAVKGTYYNAKAAVEEALV